MDDLIRRIDAIHALTQSADYIADALERLDKVHAVDAVPVVRCSKCKYGKLYLDADGHSLIQCNNPNYPTANVETWPLELDWYCAGGERRDGDA